MNVIRIIFFLIITLMVIGMIVFISYTKVKLVTKQKSSVVSFSSPSPTVDIQRIMHPTYPIEPTLSPLPPGLKAFVSKKFGYQIQYPVWVDVKEGGYYGVDGVFVANPDTTAFYVDKNYAVQAGRASDDFQLRISVVPVSHKYSESELKKELIDIYLQQRGIKQPIDVYTIGGQVAFGAGEESASGYYKIVTSTDTNLYTFSIDVNLTDSSLKMIQSFSF